MGDSVLFPFPLLIPGVADDSAKLTQEKTQSLKPIVSDGILAGGLAIVVMVVVESGWEPRVVLERISVCSHSRSFREIKET